MQVTVVNVIADKYLSMQMQNVEEDYTAQVPVLSRLIIETSAPWISSLGGVCHLGAKMAKYFTIWKKIKWSFSQNFK